MALPLLVSVIKQPAQHIKLSQRLYLAIRICRFSVKLQLVLMTLFHVVVSFYLNNIWSFKTTAVDPHLLLLNHHQPQCLKTTNNRQLCKDEYENYYIEQNKTTMVPFKTMLMPYDQDRTNLFGVMSQIVSGACNFEVTHRVKRSTLCNCNPITTYC